MTAKPGPRKRRGLSIREYADHRAKRGLVGTNKNAVQKALASGRIQYIGGDPRKGIDPETADAAWERNTSPARRHEAAAEASRASLASRVGNGLPPINGAEGPAPDYTVSRAWREHFEAQLRQLDLGERLGQLVQTELVAKQVQAMTSNVRQVLLTLPARVAPIIISELAGVEDHATRSRAVELALLEEVRSILERWQADPTGRKLAGEEAADG